MGHFTRIVPELTNLATSTPRSTADWTRNAEENAPITEVSSATASLSTSTRITYYQRPLRSGCWVCERDQIVATTTPPQGIPPAAPHANGNPIGMSRRRRNAVASRSRGRGRLYVVCLADWRFYWLITDNFICCRVPASEAASTHSYSLDCLTATGTRALFGAAVLAVL